MDGEIMLLDESADRIHVLNSSSAFIWHCLEEPMTAADIEGKLRAEYDMSKIADVPDIVDQALTQLTEAHVVRAQARG